ncbi:MAG: hypothetical protein AAGA69_00215 [Pseudomonadota bacterium]
MKAKVAVAVIHGIASQRRKRPPVSTELSFSKGLYDRVRRRLGRKVMAQDIAWREIFWADVLEDRQEAYLQRINRSTDFRKTREFIVKGIADAAAFQPRLGEGSAYAMVTERVRRTFADLNEDTSDDTPLIVLAHSFGGWIISNYVWDLQNGPEQMPTPFQNMCTIRKFITFGTNIPLFTFAYPPEQLEPIKFPGLTLGKPIPEEPWWLNYYDRDDVLGFPVAPIAPSYQALADRGELQDIQINAGSLFTSWNPLSHEQYWTDRDFVRPVAEELKKLL